MEIFADVTQWEQDWLLLRAWVITWTRLKAVNSAPSTATYKTLMQELISEDLAPLPESFQNDAMQRWNLLEPIAREEYEKQTGLKVDELGFCLHETRKYLGLSADGFVMNAKWIYDHWVEIKCMGPKNHIKAIIDNKIPAEYKWQIVNYYLINEDLETLDMFLFNPDMYLEKLQTHTIKTKRSDFEKELKEIIPKIDEFKKQWEETINNLTKK